MRIDLLLNEFVYRAVLDKSIVIFEGHFKRNFIHVRDIASAFLHAIDKFPDMRGRPFNCGLSSANMTKIELCERIQKHAPKFVYVESEIGTDPDKRNYLVSNDRIEATGFMPSRSIDDGIIELIKLYATIKNNRYGNV
jgi:nucleoside-diphosphate-sugar epimerase